MQSTVPGSGRFEPGHYDSSACGVCGLVTTTTGMHAACVDFLFFEDCRLIKYFSPVRFLKSSLKPVQESGGTLMI